MREVVEQILDGTYDYEKGALDFSCTKLEIELQKGEVYEGSFKIYASEGKYTIGHVTTSDLRMECLTPEFSGNEEEIYFRFHGEWMEEGEVVKGEFLVVSNKGEYYLPYVVSVEHTVAPSSIGPIKNLFHFANLAKTNWREAVRFYYSPAFPYVLQASEKHVSLVYQGLSAFEGNEQNVEEFLIAINKKQKVKYIIAEANIHLQNPQGVVETVLNIFRNGWGYTYLEVWTEGDFLFLEKNVLNEDDFLGNRLCLSVYVDSSVLHVGKNCGMVHLHNAYVDMQIPVEVIKNRQDSMDYEYHREMEKNIFKLMSMYQSLRLKKINTNALIKETTKLIDRMLSLDDKNPLVRLFQAHLLITKEQYNEAGWVLEHVGELMGDDVHPALEAYYLYLNTLYKDEEGYTGEISWQVTKIYKEYGEDWRVAWLLLFLAGEYDRNPATKWSFLEHQFENGCTSPLIYVEAMLLINTNPTLLRKLGRFEIQVLNYGRKKANISAEVVEQIIYLSERVKDFEPLLFDILKGCYKKSKDVRVLKEICTLLIKGNKVNSKYFEWFEKGVEKEVRITNLYEYYMLAMDLRAEPEIPKRVLLYFTYQTHLDYLHSAYLYYFVVQKQQEYPDIYTSYRPRLLPFVEEQIVKGHINHHLSFLYKRFLKELTIDERVARALSKLMFTYEIRLEQEGIRSIVVSQPNHLKDMVYPVMGDTVWVPLYGEEYFVVFENQQGCRLARDVDYTMERLLPDMGVLEEVAGFTNNNNPAFDIYMLERADKGTETGTEELYRWFRMLEYAYLPAKLRNELTIRVVKYYFDNDDKRHMVEYLCGVNGEGMTAIQRAEIIRYMVLCDQYERAYEWLEVYGDTAVDLKVLLRLAEIIVDKLNFTYEVVLTALCYRLFCQGKYSSTTIEYLMMHYQGMTRDLRKIWKSSNSYSMDRNAFCERILLQILFSGYYVGEQSEIFKEYIKGQPDKQIEDAYLAKSCYEFFVSNNLIQKDILVEISRLYEEGHTIQKICKLAYLKYYAEATTEIRNEDKHIIGAFLDNMLQEGTLLSCFHSLKQYSSKVIRLADKTIVEYHASPNSLPKIHYLIMREDGEAGDYVIEQMTNVIGDVYSKEFVLFFGESLQYYIVEETNGAEKLTQSGTCQRSEEYGTELFSRYGAINDIVISKSLQDYNTFDSLLEEYCRKEFYNQALFKLRK